MCEESPLLCVYGEQFGKTHMVGYLHIPPHRFEYEGFTAFLEVRHVIGLRAFVTLNKMLPRIALLPILLMSFSLNAVAGPFTETESRTNIIRVESVGLKALGYEELSSTATTGDERLERIVALASNGKYLVAVRSNIGVIRMKGAYLDSALTVEDGDFTFHYANGRIESEGQYVGGTKSGIWLRYAMDGARLAERNYTGLTTEQLVSAGVAAKHANQSVAVEPKPVAEAAAIRSVAPIQF